MQSFLYGIVYGIAVGVTVLIVVGFLQACEKIAPEDYEASYYHCSLKAQSAKPSDITGGTIINEIAAITRLRNEVNERIEKCMNEVRK